MTGATPPSDRIVMGFIGVGGMGGGHVRSCLQYEDVRDAAICDVRLEHRERSSQQVNERYADNFLDAVRLGVQPISTIESALNSDVVCHQADIAMRLKRKPRRDTKTEQLVDDGEANRWLSRAMRPPWRA